MLNKIVKKYKSLGSFQKRGIVYIAVSALFLTYELFFHDPPRPVVVLLWLGVVVIAVSVIFILKDPER